MHESNLLPKDAQIITEYDKFQDFFAYLDEEEFRQVAYDETNSMSGLYSIRIFWIDKSLGLGHGIAQDWKNKKIVFYRFGSLINWKKFNRQLIEQFAGDNS